MNLTFDAVSRKMVKGREFILQRAVVDRGNREFWIAWRAGRTSNFPTSLRRLGNLMKEGDDWAFYRVIPADGGLPVPLPRRYNVRYRKGLLPYQPKAVSAICASLMERGHAVDMSDTGIGKSYHGIAACREVGKRPVIVCKLAGVAAWKQACDQLGVDPLLITNYEALKFGRNRFCTRVSDEEYRWNVPRTAMFIFDEAHSANNWGTLNNLLFMDSKPYPSIAMSATLADRPERMGPFLDVLGVSSRGNFMAWLAERGRYQDQYEKECSLSDRQDLAVIHKTIFPGCGARISYDDPEVAKYFPQCNASTMRLSIGTKSEKRQNALYDKLCVMVEKYRALGKQADILVADLRYRQEAELLKAPSLVSITEDLLSQGNSVCMFINFRATLSYLSRRLKTSSCIYGGQSVSKRDRVLSDFQSNQSRLILLMIDAGGQSLSLHDLHGGHRRVSLICPTYNPVTLRQVYGRTRRAGSQTLPVIRLVYAAGVEEKVAARVQSKLKNLDALNDGDMVEPGLEGVQR